MNKYRMGTVCCGIAAALTGLSSCADFLEIKPQDKIILEDFWTEKADVDNVVMGCYSALQADAVRKRMIIWGEVRSDHIQSGQNINNDVNLYNIVKENITAMNTYTTWEAFYDVINRCNTVLKYAPGVAAEDPGYTQGDLNATIAEVTALRSLCYFYLIRTFRNVPYSSVAFTDDDQKMDLPATPFYDVLDSLITDLERVKNDAVVRYPETKPRYQTGRITRDAIYSMLCELYLWKKDYDNCIRYAELVIDSKKEMYEEELSKGGNNSMRNQTTKNYVTNRLNGYPLELDAISGSYFGDAYQAIFATGHSRETIFELNYDSNPEGTGMPSSRAISDFYGHSNSHKGLLAPTSAVSDDVTATSGRAIFEDKNKKLDARMYINLDASGGNITKLATSSIDINATSPTDVKVGDGGYSYYTQNNNSSQWVIYRLPDIMLLEAEAICQKMQEGNEQSVLDYNAPLLEQAFRLVNAINKRSICKTATLVDDDTLKLADYNTKSLMEELVIRERQRELMFEGKRWYDLVRYSLRDNNTTRLVAAVMKRDDVNATFAQNFFKKMDAIFWPYNNEEMKVNKNLEPNPVFGSGESSSYEKTK